MCQHIIITRVLIGKHIKFDVLCLHTSIMATDLRLRKDLPLNLSAGMVVTFKSSIFSLARNYTLSLETYLDLYNINNDIILRITICRKKKNEVFSMIVRETFLAAMVGDRAQENLRVTCESPASSLAVTCETLASWVRDLRVLASHLYYL